jgi:CheY-like chemotaxis protein
MSSLDVPSPQSTKQTIVAVDDDTAIVQLCTTILDQAGFSVLPATNSSEALKICKNHPGPIHLL